jgi:mannitol 2-dehydrogenase
VVRHQLETGGEIRRSAAVIAAWARYADGVDEDGGRIEVVDALRDELAARARRRRTDPDAFLANRALFGDLVDDERFASAYRATLASLDQHGARATVESLVRTSQ